MKKRKNPIWYVGDFADENGWVYHSQRILARTKSEATALLKKQSREGHKLVSVEML